MNFLRQATKRVLTACLPPQWLLTRGPRHASNERPRLALTFDDGPHPVYTARLLDVLRTAGLSATFFVVGRNAAQHPKLIERMADEGHELANHTWSHGEPAQTSPRQFLDEVQQTDDLLRNLTGTVSRAMRPPKGNLNWTKLSGLWRQGKTVALWNVDPRDYCMNNAGEMAVWTAQYAPRDGDVLLFHDNHPWAVGAIESMLHRGVFNRCQAVAISTMTRRDKLIPAPAESPRATTASP